MLLRSARLNPNAIATKFMGRETHWPQLLERIGCLASALSEYKLGDGERAAILSLNSDRYFESIFAITWAGYSVVPLNTRWAVAENEYALTDSGSRVLFFDDAFLEQAEQLKGLMPSLEHLVYIGEGSAPSWAEHCDSLIKTHNAIAPSTRSDQDMAGIFYTGGTTGFPKGVILSHKALWSSAVGAVGYFDITPESSYLHAAPMFHAADFALSMMTILSGGTHSFLQTFDPGVLLELLEREAITHGMLVPAMIKMLLQHPATKTTDLSKLECIGYGASPMPAALLQEAMTLWPTVNFCQAYGQTELSPIATILSAEDHRRGGKPLSSAGRPTPVNDIRLIDSNGNDVPVGEQGEVLVRGPHTMTGYWNKPEATAETLIDGWVHTGDGGIFDEQGYLYIVDRLKDMIITGGENVYTTEVENALISHPAVQDVAVIGIPSDKWGELVHAIVILADGAAATEEALIAHSRESIAAYKCPKSITFRTDPLPLSGANKVLKTELRKPYWQGKNKQVS